MAAVTYLTRVPLWLLGTRRVSPRPRVDRVLEQIPIAAFAAIVFPGVLQPNGETSLEPSNLYLYAAVVTAFAAVGFSGRLFPTILTGTGVAMLLQLVFG